MTDPVEGNVQGVKRRRSRRHRRNRRIRRWLAAAVFALFVASVSTLALKYLSPSLVSGGSQCTSQLGTGGA